MPELRFGGGVNELDDESIHPDECVEGENFVLNKTARSFRPRKPFDLKDTATNAGEIVGIHQLVKRDNTETTLVIADTVAYLWDGSTFTSKNTVTTGGKFTDTYWSLDDELVICDSNLVNVVKNWDGTTFGDQTHGIAATSLYAKKSIVHNGRVWLFNVKANSTESPHMCVASQFENHNVYDITKRSGDASFTTGAEAFYLLSPDLKPFNDVVKFFDTVIASTEDGGLYKLTGTTSANYAWLPFYAHSSATGTHSMVDVGNDILYMRKGGNIESVRTTDQFGDINTDDISYKIPSQTDGVTSCYSVYDQKEQRTYFFISGKVLVLDKEIQLAGEVSPWSVYTTQHSSGFNTKAAKYMRRPGTTDYTVYFGDASGNVFDINGTGTSGDGGIALIKTYRKTALISSLDTMNNILYGRIQYRRQGICTVQMDFDWSEEYSKTTSSAPLLGPITSEGTNFYGSSSSPVYYSDAHYYGAGGVEEFKISTVGFSPSGKGPSFFLTMTLNTNVRFLINKVEA